MRSLAPIGFGLRGAGRRPGLVLLVYLASLVPALLVAVEAFRAFSAGLSRSLFAEQALAGNRWGVWKELGRDPATDLSGVLGGLPALGALALLLQVLVAAGAVEVLLFREPRGEHPFLLGIGRHGWRFLRTASWFVLATVILVGAVAALLALIGEQARQAADARLQLAGWLGGLLLGLVVFVPLDLGHHLSRIAAAGHGEGRTFVGFLRAVGHVCRHPLRLAPLWLFFTVVPAVPLLGYVLGRAAVAPSHGGHLALLLVVQQVLFLLVAFLRVSRWGAEIAYYQAIGEPRWCGRRERARPAKRAPDAAVATARGEETGPDPAPLGDGGPGSDAGPSGDPSARPGTAPSTG